MIITSFYKYLTLFFCINFNNEIITRYLPRQDIVPLDSSVGPVGYDYMVDKATVSQLGRDDSVLATYEFFNMWPTNLGAIELDTEGGDAVEIFDVEFAYSHFERTR